MRKLFLTIAFLAMLTASAFASNTYYVTKNGGTASQCSGLSNKPYTPVVSDITHDCALNHPFWVLAPQGNNPTKMVGGDTLFIDGTSSAQYVIGLGAPNTSDGSKCSPNWPWDCYQRAVPSGPDATHPTRILGTGYDTGCSAAPQLWGNERVGQILNLNGSNNVELQCLDITDHSECIDQGPNACNRNTIPYGAWAGYGLVASDSNNVYVRNVKIHGLGHGAVHAGRISNWTIEDSQLLSNPWVGWDGDIGKGISSNSGTIKFIHDKIKYSGCGERLDGTPYSCFSQSQGGYGDALGTQQTGGDWYFDGVEVTNNVSDGIDLLYHDGNGKVTIKNSIIGGNAGNQIKVSAPATIDNTQVTGNCDFFKNNPISFNGATFDNCRAGGDAVVFSMKPGAKESITNSSIKNILNIGIITTGSSCNGAESVTVDTNTTFEYKPKFFDPSSTSVKYYASGATGNGDGACGTVKLTTVASIPPACVPNGSCTAVVPACGTSTSGVDNCGTACTKVGPQCCVPDGSCSAATPACGLTTSGINNCGTACSKQGVPCCVSDSTKCNAAIPACGTTTSGVDNCGVACSKVGAACTTGLTSCTVVVDGKTYSITK